MIVSTKDRHQARESSCVVPPRLPISESLRRVRDMQKRLRLGKRSRLRQALAAMKRLLSRTLSTSHGT